MFNELTQSVMLITEQTKANYTSLAIIALVPSFFYVLSLLTNHRLLVLGIFPRHLAGFLGIFFAPLLHANFNHLFFNLIPLVVLSNFVLIDGIDLYWKVTIFVTLCSGFLIWCLGKPGLHVGASALVTGLWGFLVSNIVQQGTVTAIILGIVCLYYFAGIFLGIFPKEKGVSWEGHLFGLIAGVLASYIFAR